MSLFMEKESMGETGDADKEAAPLMQATDQLQKATQLHKG